jgi:SMC interacting uncharacterized protein involved in chromosome segregation
MENNATWLREHMRNHLADSAIDPREKVLRFPNASPPSAREEQAALDLVSQAAQVIRTIEVEAATVEARARSLVQDAVEKLKLAESRIQSVDTARRTAEKCMREANARAEEAEKGIKEAQSLAAAAKAELYAMELRVKAAETRADETKHALIRVEDAIRTQLLDLRTTHNKRIAAA